ncbi:MAG: flippase-like domain-containing protein [Promicromonosporaceae bacterium]|nr:flippase-like domain-containing protein [Promicromonosporaceae bacterium]
MAEPVDTRVPFIGRGVTVAIPVGDPLSSTPIVVPGQPTPNPSSGDPTGGLGTAQATPPETGAIPVVVPGDHTRALSAAVFEAGEPNTAGVRIIDDPQPRLRKPRNVLGITFCLLGIATVLLLAYFAQDTTEAIDQDVRGFMAIAANVLRIPAGWLEGLVAWVLPLAVLIELSIRRLGRLIVESVIGFLSGLLLALLTHRLIGLFGTQLFIESLSVAPTEEGGDFIFAIPFFISALVAILTVAGPRTRRRTVRWSWNLLWIALIMLLLARAAALPALIVGLLLGRIAGLAVQWVSGVRSERAYGDSLVSAINRAGFSPMALVRVSDLGEATSWDTLSTPHDTVPLRRADVLAYAAAIDDASALLSPDETPPSQAPSALPPTIVPRSDAAAVARSSDPAAVALARSGDNRVYAMLNDDGGRYDVVVLDGDRQVIGFLSRIWRSLRLRGIEGRASINLRAVIERTALLSYAATSAGVRTPRLLGMGLAEDSATLVLEHARGAVSFRDLPDAEFAEPTGEQIMAQAFKQLQRAHAAGLSHHQLTPDVLLMHRDDEGRPHVWISGWEQGEVASSTLAKRLDLTQLLALLALRVGASRAVAAAAQALPEAEIAAIGPLLQTVALPNTTRQAVRERKGLMSELRDALVNRLPEASVEPQRLVRFGARTVVMAILVVMALAVVVTTFQFDQILEAITTANPWWMGVAAGASTATWVGGALTLSAFSPVRIKFRKAMFVQMAGSFVALATPAGIGPAALNLRFLTRKGSSTPMAVATVALVQVSQIVVTVTLLLILSLATGTGGLVAAPPREVMIAIGVILGIVGVLLLVPPIRKWAWVRIQPTLGQVWPRLAQILETPSRLALGFAGNATMTIGNVVALYAALMAFGQAQLALVAIAVIYLVGNTTGALLPTPGGIGGVDLALGGGLTAAGLHPGIAVTVVLLFRVVTYWARIPIGWVAMRRLERAGEL